jgi:N-carbamoyl-L-amino-acid hydrolase
MTLTIAIDSARLTHEIDELATLSEAPAPAVTRVLFSETDRRARAWMRARCLEAGLTMREDAVGNVFARWVGTDPAIPALATGSHIDAIPNAGRYDGVVGVLGGLEAIRALKRAGLTPRRSIELVIFTAEEPTRFGIGCLGSRLMSGSLSAERAAALRDPNGESLDDWRARAGVTGDLAGVRLSPGGYAAFIELHIEQGPRLEQLGKPIGVVTAIAGPSSSRVTLTGEGGHAGAVLMPDRHDAGLAGAEIALAVERAARESGSPDTVGTTGVFRQLPNAVNSIPSHVVLEIDFRDARLDTRQAAWSRVEAEIAAIAARRGVAVQVESLNADAPAVCPSELVEFVAEAAAVRGHAVERMVSRAYHDSLFMAQLCPTTMIFIPCRAGVSHRPDEFSSPEQIAAGVDVLACVLGSLST